MIERLEPLRIPLAAAHAQPHQGQMARVAAHKRNGGNVEDSGWEQRGRGRPLTGAHELCAMPVHSGWSTVDKPRAAAPAPPGAPPSHAPASHCRTGTPLVPCTRRRREVLPYNAHSAPARSRAPTLHTPGTWRSPAPRTGAGRAPARSLRQQRGEVVPHRRIQHRPLRPPPPVLPPALPHRPLPGHTSPGHKLPPGSYETPPSPLWECQAAGSIPAALSRTHF